MARSDPLVPGEFKKGLIRRDSMELRRGSRSSLGKRTGSARSSSSHRTDQSEDDYAEDFEEYDDEEELKFDEPGLASKYAGILATAKTVSDRKWNRGKRRVSFSKNATVHYMPSHELEAARRSRKGSWEPAPEHDELWDGDLQAFRRVPLTSEQLKRKLSNHHFYEHEEMFSSTYPPTYTSSHYSTDFDELDSYMDDLSFGTNSASAAPLTSFSSSIGRSSSFSVDLHRASRPAAGPNCYQCLPTIDWPTSVVSAFVRDHVAGGEFFCITFEQSYVDGPMFLQMEERDLRNIGIKRRADRQAILAARSELLRGSLAQQRCSCSQSRLL